MNLSKLAKASDLASASTQKIVFESSEIAAELTSQLRTVSYLLHPPLLDEIGLAAALEWYVQGFTERSKISVALEVSEDFGRLDLNTRLPLARLVPWILSLKTNWLIGWSILFRRVMDKPMD
jgi:two-component system, NarL family, sensor kinase